LLPTLQVIMSTDMIKQIEDRLSRAIKLFQSRLDWLTSDSRRLFGVVEEKCVCIVLDLSQNSTQQQFDLYIGALETVIREQISRLSRFNIIRCVHCVVCYTSQRVSLTSGPYFLLCYEIQSQLPQCDFSYWVHSITSFGA